MEKINKSHIYAAFIRLANALNKPVYIDKATKAKFLKDNKYYPQPKIVAEKWNEVGSWQLDYASCYDGNGVCAINRFYGEDRSQREESANTCLQFGMHHRFNSQVLFGFCINRSGSRTKS